MAPSATLKSKIKTLTKRIEEILPEYKEEIYINKSKMILIDDDIIKDIIISLLVEHDLNAKLQMHEIESLINKKFNKYAPAMAKLTINEKQELLNLMQNIVYHVVPRCVLE